MAIDYMFMDLHEYWRPKRTVSMVWIGVSKEDQQHPYYKACERIAKTLPAFKGAWAGHMTAMRLNEERSKRDAV